MSTRVWWLVVVLLMAVAGNRAALAQAPKAQWTIAVPEEAEILDPPRTITVGSDVYLSHVFDPLVGIEGDDLRTVGLLAERWEAVTPTTWRFFLRRGVKFHNGQPFDAEDVKYSLESYMDPKSRRISWARPILRVEIRDPYTVDVVTAQPFGGFLTNIARLFILPKASREKLGPEAFGQKPVGTGAYTVIEWKRDQQLTLEANPAYWQGVPSPRRLVFRPIRDPGTRAAELRAGGVDIIATPPATQVDLLDQGETQVRAAKAARLLLYPFNLSEPPFDSRQVRQAVNLAVNKDAIVKNILGGRGVVIASVFTSTWLGFDPAVAPFPYDPARARQLLAAAGYPQGFDTTWHITSGLYLKDTEIAEAVAGQLRQVGIRVTLVPEERARALKDIEQGTFKGMTTVTWGAQFEPDLMLSYLNRPHMMLPALAERIEAGRRELDPDKRRQIYRDLYRAASDEALCFFLYAQDELWAKRRDINWSPSPFTGQRAFTYYYQRGGAR